ncbi:MAG: hypothetical protein NVSMB25_10510 [Thermoleophilaceae bacterium]
MSLWRTAAVFATALALTGAAPARADPFLPPGGQVFAGLTGGHGVESYAQEVHAHPSVFQFFSSWNQPTEWMFQAAESAHARLMIHLSTSDATPPRAIAMGRSDAYLVRLGARIAEGGQVAYLRVMAEMNGHWNPYCAFDAGGRPRGPDHTTQMFRRAWQRTVLIVRGGRVADIDSRLARLGLPPVAVGSAVLPQPKVAFLWVPQVAGAPDTPANSPRAYWPGAEYVDWVGTDFYARYPNFSGLERFYRQFPGKPFAFGEWAMWGRDDPAFVRRLFAWVRSHGRVRMMMYNQGNRARGPFRLLHYPRSRLVIANELSAPRFREGSGS